MWTQFPLDLLLSPVLVQLREGDGSRELAQSPDLNIYLWLPSLSKDPLCATGGKWTCLIKSKHPGLHPLYMT